MNASPAFADSPDSEEPPLGSIRSNPYPSPGALSLRGSNGYDVYVASSPARGKEPSRVTFAAADRDGQVNYTVPGDLEGEGVRANFGRLGRIDLRWQPSGRVARVAVRCKHYRYQLFVAEGSYVGTLRLHGLGSFTRATAHRIPGRTGWFALRSCEFRTSSGFPGPGEMLYAERLPTREPEGSERYLNVVQSEPRAKVSYQAVDQQALGRLSIRRFAGSTGGRHSLSFDPSFRSATIHPPSPFHGSASFERRKHALGSWLGDLTVDFPDLTGVRLAGADFEAKFQSGYTETVPLAAFPVPKASPLALPAWPSTKP